MKFNFKNVDRATWVRITVLFLMLVNQVCVSIFNFQLLPFNDEQLYENISTAFTVGASILAGWKNNSFTPEAQKADAYLNKLKY